MRTYSLVLLSIILMIYHESGYTNDIGERETKETTETKGKHKQVTLNFDQQSPNVDIRSYVLITDKLDADRVEAEAIMRLRAKLPLAVQTKDAALFNSILARDFTFRAADEFWNREDYIRNRVEESETALSAHYENVVLQLFGDVAVSTYRNAIELNDNRGKAGTLQITLASVYVKADGRWKIGAVYLINKK
jgi:ketosteroid isomerase-like protein